MLDPSALRLPEADAADRPRQAGARRAQLPEGTGGEPSGPLSLWLVNAVTEDGSAARLAPRLLDAEEAQRAQGFKRAHDRRCYVTAHVALRLLLARRVGLAPEAVELVRETCPSCGGAHGRPAVAGGGVHFSLSHSGDLALIALAERPVGVDVEGIPSAEMVADTGKALHPAETAELSRLPLADRPAAFARAWARKEAYLKGIGTGLSRNPAHDYVGTGPRPAHGPAQWTISDVAVPERFVAAVAIENPHPQG